MTEKSVEVGPIVAAAMIAIGLATVVWAVATNPRQDVGQPSFATVTGTAAPSLDEAEPGGVSDAEWEATLVDVEKLKTEGVIAKIDPEAQAATVSSEKWSALDEDRRREIGRHLAIYCGRISGSDRYQVEIRDENGSKLESYQRE